MKSSKFYRHLFFLTLPIILQNLVTTSLNLLDTLMIGKIGEVPLAAVGIANQYYFLFSLFIFGIAGGSGVLIAQLYGKKDSDTIRQVLSRTLFTGTTFSIVFSLIGLSCAESIIQLFNDSPEIVSIGSLYLRITIVSYLFTSISFIFASALRSVNNTKLPMYASVIGLCVNGALNYILIFGHLGFSPLHTKGAAIATLIARTLECFILVISVIKYAPELLPKTSDLNGCSSETEHTLRKVTLPILFNEACWGIGSVTYIALYAHLGTQATATMQISSTIINLFMVISFGLAYSSLVIVGNEVGAGQNRKAMEAAQKIRVLTVSISVILSLIVFLSAEHIATGFNVSSTVALMTTNVLKCFALMFTLRTLNMVMIVGILRGGGDATFGSVLQGFTLWFIGIPLTYVAGFIYHYPLHYVVGISIVEEIVKLLLITRRYHSKRWIHNIVESPSTIEYAIE